MAAVVIDVVDLDLRYFFTTTVKEQYKAFVSLLLFIAKSCQNCRAATKKSIL
jgi:hypothetical protein